MAGGQPTPLQARIQELLSRDLPQGSEVLDLSAGTGLATYPAAARARRVIATEEYLSVVREAAAGARARGLSVIRHVLAEPAALPLRPGSVDAVVCVNALHGYRRLGAVLGEVRRVIRPSGVFLSATYCHRDTPRKWPKWGEVPGGVRVAQSFSRKSLEATVAKARFAVAAADVLSTDPFVLYMAARPA